MSKCPQCNAELSTTDFRSGRCPTCDAALKTVADVDATPAASEDLPKEGASADTLSEIGTSPVETQTSSSPNLTMEVVAPEQPGPSIPHEQAKTFDLAESAHGIDTVVVPDLPGEPSEQGTPAAADDGTINTLDLQRAVETIELAAEKTVPDQRLSPTTGVDTPVNLPELDKHVTATWGLAVDETTPQTTIKQSVGSVVAPKSTLVIQSRAVSEPASQQGATADYDLIGLLGEGGMGVVYTARQASIDRTVAVKMLKPQQAADQAQKQKFLSEAVVTGELDHPNIVPIYDLGRNADGALFYSMKKVQGTPWMNAIQNKSLHDNLEILLKVADAVAFAHSRGVIHRDLKPENVMLGEFGEVLVLDWGLAIATPDCEKVANLATNSGLGGTPVYMAPEMAVGPIERIGKHSDIYLLGAILYECVTGRPPHTGKTAMLCMMAAAKNEIVRTEHAGELVDIALRAMATDPEARFASVQMLQQAIRDYQSHSESIALSARASAELEEAKKSGDYNEYAKALYVFEEAYELWDKNTQAKDGISKAKQAYAAAALGKGDYDLGLSILDADDPTHKKLRVELEKEQRQRDARQQRLKNAKRMIVGLVALVFLVVTVLMFVFIFLRAKAEASEKRAVEQRQLAEKNEKKAVENETKAVAEEKRAKAEWERAEANEKQAVEQKQLAEKNEKEAIAARQEAEYEAYVAWIGLAAAKIEENAPGQALEVLNNCELKLRSWEWRRLMHQCQQGIGTLHVGFQLDGVAFNADGTLVVTGSRNGTAQVWNVSTKQPIGKPLQLKEGYVSAVAFCPVDDRIVAVGSSSDPTGYLRIWNTVSGDAFPMQGHTDEVASVAFSKDGTRLLTASFDNTAKLWDVETLALVREFRGHGWRVSSATFSPDEQRIVTASDDGTVRVWVTATGEQLRENGQVRPFRGHEGPVFAASFSPDGEYIVSGGYDKRVLVWKPAELSAFDFKALLSQKDVPPPSYVELRGHTAAVRSVQFSPDGKRILSGSHDNSIKVWELWYARSDETGDDRITKGTLEKTLRGHDSLVRSASFSPVDSDQVVSASFDGDVRFWSIRDYEEQRVIPGVILQGHTDAVLRAEFSPSGEQIVTASRDRTAKTWRTSGGELSHSFREGHLYLASRALFFPGGKKLATSAADGTILVWNVDTGAQLLKIEGAGPSAAAAVSHDGRWILTGSDKQPIGNEATGSGPSFARLWDADTGDYIRSFGEHKARVTAVAFSPQSRLVFTGDANGRGNLWEAETGRQIATLREHTRRITSAVFLPDGKSLLTGSVDSAVFQWDLSVVDSPRQQSPTGVLHPSRLLPHDGAVTSLAITEDGRRVLTGCEDGATRLWDLDQAELIWTWQSKQGGEVNSVAVSSNASQALAVDSANNVVHLLDIDRGREIMVPDEDGEAHHFLRLKERDVLVWSAIFSPDGSHVVTVGGDEARLWDLQGKEHMRLGPHHTVAWASFSPDEKLIVTASWDNSAKIWDVSEGKSILTLADHVAGKQGAHSGRVNSAVFSPDGTNILTASDDKTVKLWDTTTGKVLRTFEGHQAGVLHAVFSEDGGRVVSSSRDKTARIWNVDSDEPPVVLTGHKLDVLQAAFSPDGTRVVTGSADFSAKVWDAKTGKELFPLPHFTASVNAVAYSPEGDRILTGCADRTVRLWDVDPDREPREVLTLKGHTREVTSVAFSKEGSSAKYALSGSRDGTAIVWLATEGNDDADAGSSDLRTAEITLWGTPADSETNGAATAPTTAEPKR